MDRFSAMFWEQDSQPGFETLVISGVQFKTPEEAEEYGIAAFGEYFAGVQQIRWVNEEKPF